MRAATGIPAGSPGRTGSHCSPPVPVLYSPSSVPAYKVVNGPLVASRRKALTLAFRGRPALTLAQVAPASVVFSTPP